MELLFLALLIVLMAVALASGFPVAFALPGSAIITIGAAALAGEVFAGHADAFFAQGSPINWLSAGVTNFRGVYWEVERDTLIAIPLFVFMGIMLQRSKIAEDLLISMAQLFGPIRGGLGISVVFVGGLLAATTGILGATVVAMGLISLPAMMRNNYSNALSTGTIAASGTLGQIIPPSIVLIILADQLSNAVDQADTARKALYKSVTGEFSVPSEFSVVSTSAGDMFMGALFPGLVLVGLYMLYILVLSFIRPAAAPSVPFEGKFDRYFAIKVGLSLIPPLTLIFLVLGSIISGIATVNQAGAIGAVGATVMAGYRLFEGRRGQFYPAILSLVSLAVLLYLTNSYYINVRDIRDASEAMAVAVAAVAATLFMVGVVWSLWRTLRIGDTLKGVMIETAKTSSLVFIILLGAAMLTAAFRAFGGEELVRDFLTGLPGGFWAQFVIVMAVIFLLGFFLDFIEIAVVVVPIVAPILLADPSANITAVWFGVMIGLNIQTSFLTPPFGFALFYLRGVAPAAVRTIDMYKGVVPFIALQLIALAIVGATPPLVNYLPTRVSLLGETAPPPKNPRLQACMEEYTAGRFAEDGDAIRAMIERARRWDLSAIPEDLAQPVAKSLDDAEAVFGNLQAARDASAALDAMEPAYMPLHNEVRALQADIDRIDAEIKDAKDDVNREKRKREDASEQRLADLMARVEALEADRAAVEASIPEAWAEQRKAFKELLSDEKRALLTYRRTADNAYEPVRALLNAIDGITPLTALEDEVRGLAEIVGTRSVEEAEKAFRPVESAIGEVPGAGDLRNALAEVRRDLDKDLPAAKAKLDEAIALYDREVAWRRQAQKDLQSPLEDYEAAIRDTIGLRAQDRLPRPVALEVASCLSNHSDISRYF